MKTFPTYFLPNIENLCIYIYRWTSSVWINLLCQNISPIEKTLTDEFIQTNKYFPMGKVLWKFSQINQYCKINANMKMGIINTRDSGEIIINYQFIN